MPRLAHRLLLSLLLAPAAPALAEGLDVGSQVSNNMLPAGLWGVRSETQVARAWRVFDDRGRPGGIVADLDRLSLDNSVIGLLPPGTSLGTTQVSSHMEGVRERLTIAYGASDDLTVGVILPWGMLRHEVDFALAPGNLGVNPLFNPGAPIAGSNLPFVPAIPGLVDPASAGDVQSILTSPAFGFEYKPLRSVTRRGILNPVVGFRWQFHREPGQSLVLSGGWRIAMVDRNDPDDLLDAQWENDTHDLLVGGDWYRELGRSWDLRLATQATVQLPDHAVARARSANEFLVPKSRTERLRRDVGDYLNVIGELGYKVADWRFSGKVEAQWKQADDWDSPRGQDVSGLEDDTDQYFTNLWFGVSWNGIRAWQNGRSPLPLIASLEYATTVDGRNVLAADSLYLKLTMPVR